MNISEIQTPQPVLGLYEEPMWESIRARKMRLQRCSDCGATRYPPGPTCPACLSANAEWEPISGRGVIVSWVVFHRQYLPAYSAPYNVIAVRLEEGPIFISNLEGEEPEDSWIGRPVRMVYRAMPDGFLLPRFVLDDATDAGSPHV